MGWAIIDELRHNRTYNETVAEVRSGAKLCPACCGEGVLYEKYYSGQSDKCPICLGKDWPEPRPISQEAYQRAQDHMGPALTDEQLDALYGALGAPPF